MRSRYMSGPIWTLTKGVDVAGTGEGKGEDR